MKSLTVIIMIILSLNEMQSQTINDNFSFEINGIIRSTTNRNNVVAVAGGTGLKVDTKYGTSIFISVYENGIWTHLPRTIERNGKHDTLFSQGNMNIAIDSKGHIWVSGESLFKFDGVKWTEYFINDEYHGNGINAHRNNGNRSYNQLIIDKNDKIYVTSSVRLFENDTVQFSEIHSFENNEFKSLIKKDNDAYFQMNQGYTRNRPFIALKDGSVLLAHNTDYSVKDNFVDLTHILPDGTIKQYLTNPPDNVSSGNKTIPRIIQDKEGTIWFAHMGGMKNLDENCCSGMTKTTDLINFQPITENEGMPIYQNRIYPSVLGLLELNNGDILFIADQNNLSLYKYEFITKRVVKLHWQDVMKNSTLIRKSTTNKNFPIEWYENILNVYNSDTPKNTDHSQFQSMNITENGILFLTFSDFVLQIPIESITSVQNDNQTTSMLYPNPSNDVVKIRTTKEITTVTITDILGKKIELQNSGIGTYSTSNIPSGFYTVVITYIDNSIECHSFIKQ